MHQTNSIVPSIAIREAEDRLQTLLPGMYRDRTEDVRPVSMGSAPLAFDVDGNVAWDKMWGSFCDLAMAGGPPHKGKLLEPSALAAIESAPSRFREVCAEIARGIALAARMPVEISGDPGWVSLRCSNPTMAGWLLRAITMENVSVRLDGSSVLLPAGPEFRIEKEIKNVITVAAKTTHYWSGHLIRLQQLGIANLFHELEAEAPLLQPGWQMDERNAACRPQIEATLVENTRLAITHHSYSNWIGLDCGEVQAAVVTMRRLVASNILCRREDTAIFVPINAEMDANGDRLSSSLAALLA